MFFRSGSFHCAFVFLLDLPYVRGPGKHLCNVCEEFTCYPGFHTPAQSPLRYVYSGIRQEKDWESGKLLRQAVTLGSRFCRASVKCQDDQIEPVFMLQLLRSLMAIVNGYRVSSAFQYFHSRVSTP